MTRLPSKPSKLELLALAAILLLATALRTYELNAGLWYDEILTLKDFVRLPPETLIHTYGSLNNHILYTWMAKGSVALFGETATALRLPAVLLGLGSIAAVWLLVRRMATPGVALATALLLAVSYHHVWFSQNARGYTGMMLFATLAGWSLLRALASTRMSWWMVFGVMSAGALLVHLSSIFVIAGLGVALLGHILLTCHASPAVAGRLARGSLLAAVACTAVVLPIYLPLAPDMTHAFGDVSSVGDGASKPSSFDAFQNPLRTATEILASFGLLGAALVFATALAIWGGVRFYRAAPVVTIGLALSIPITLAALVAGGMRIWPRYFFTDIGFLAACSVAGAFAAAELLATVLRRPEWKGRLTAFVTAAMALASLPLLIKNYQHPKQDFEGARAYVLAQGPAAGCVATAGLAKVAFTDYLAPDWADVSTGGLSERAVDCRDIWVVTAFPDHLRSHYPELAAQLASSFEAEKSFPGTLEGGKIVVWKRSANMTSARSDDHASR